MRNDDKKMKAYLKLILEKIFFTILGGGNGSRHPLIRLGSQYGGWVLANFEVLQGCTIVSAGLGEDASFDVEFAQKFNATVLLVDPTPRAIDHYHKIIESIGNQKVSDYTCDGNQPVSSYDLTNLTKNQLIIDKRALWDKNTTRNFFAPKNINYVSYSLNDSENKINSNDRDIEVATTTLSRLLTEHNIEGLRVLKLDIEGSEIDVIKDMFATKIIPDQLLVEFDCLGSINVKNFVKVICINKDLKKIGYSLLHIENLTNFLYVHKKSFQPLK